MSTGTFFGFRDLKLPVLVTPGEEPKGNKFNRDRKTKTTVIFCCLCSNWGNFSSLPAPLYPFLGEKMRNNLSKPEDRQQTSDHDCRTHGPSI